MPVPGVRLESLGRLGGVELVMPVPAPPGPSEAPRCLGRGKSKLNRAGPPARPPPGWRPPVELRNTLIVASAFAGSGEQAEEARRVLVEEGFTLSPYSRGRCVVFHCREDTLPRAAEVLAGLGFDRLSILVSLWSARLGGMPGWRRVRLLDAAKRLGLAWSPEGLTGVLAGGKVHLSPSGNVVIAVRGLRREAEGVLYHLLAELGV